MLRVCRASTKAEASAFILAAYRAVIRPYPDPRVQGLGKNSLF